MDYNKEALRKMRFDMHVHTTASDGVYSPAEIVAQAAELGLAGLAITDHDTLDGLPEAAEAARAKGLHLIFGVELNCRLTAADDSPRVHMLGYYLDLREPTLRRKLRQLQEHRLLRGRKMLELLAQFDMPLDMELLNEYAEKGSIGRGTIALKLVEAGYVKDRDEAFAKWLDVGKPCYVPRLHVTVPEAVQLIHRAGGVAVMAHPAQYHNDALPGLAAPYGLDGMECRHPDQPAAVQPKYLQLAAELGLAVTGGSDCHTGGLGEYTMDGLEMLELLRRRRG